MAGKSIDQTTAKLIFEVVLRRYDVEEEDIEGIMVQVDELFSKYE
jgi:hypothetical protein